MQSIRWIAASHGTPAASWKANPMKDDTDTTIGPKIDWAKSLNDSMERTNVWRIRFEIALVVAAVGWSALVALFCMAISK